MNSVINLITVALPRHFGQAASCTLDTGGFFGLPTWYKYLNGVWVDTYDVTTNTMRPICSPHLSGIGDGWLVILAIIDILLRVIGVIAVGWVIWGGIQYVISQGEPDRTKRAKDTILNAMIGLVIAMTAVALIGFAGSQFK